MTIHISKGLEFPYVFLCGFTEGVLPSAMSLKDRRKRALEEERRLTYVAITRAEKRFYMTESEGFNYTNGLNKYPSRFLFEISDEFYIRKGELSKDIIEEAKQNLNKNEVDNIIVFKIGDQVFHDIWKKGIVKEVDVDKNQYLIDFIEIGKQKPIDFSFKFLKKIIESEVLTDELKIAKKESDDDWNKFVNMLPSNDNKDEELSYENSNEIFENNLEIDELIIEDEINHEPKKWWKFKF